VNRFIFLFHSSTFAEGNSIQFSIFTRPDCVHCIELKKWLDTSPLSSKNIEPKYYDITLPENRAIYDDFTELN
jgi:glutaredoxin